MEYARLLLSALASLAVSLVGVFRPKRPPKLLVVKLDHLGDVVTATPALRSLRAAFPGAPIHALVGPWATDVLAGKPSLDRVIPSDSARVRRPGIAAGDARPPLRVMRAVAAERYTHVIELRGDSWTLLLPFLSHATRRVDRGTIRIMSWLSRRVPGRGSGHTQGPPLHEVETNLAVVRPLVGSVEVGTPKVEVLLLDEDREGAATRLRALGIPGGAPLVTIHPGASWRPRAWRAERFAEVGRRILERNGTHVLFVGSAEERDIADSIGALLLDRRAHFLFDAPIREIAAILERSALFIGNDSGIAHLAAACGTSVVALYGPQDPRRFRPWSDRAVVLHKPVSCFPCSQIVCVRPENPCVNLNSVEEVMRSAEALLGPPVEARPAT